MNYLFATFQEFSDRMLELSYWDWLSDIHGGLSMSTLILFGAAITLYFSLDKFAKAWEWLRNVAIALAVNVALLDFMGLFIYRPYREKVSGLSPRTLLKADPDTAWLHTIIFEHKEHLAFAPLLVMIVVAMVLTAQGRSIKDKKSLRKVILFGIIASLVMVLVVAAEAVLVTKVQPLK